MVVVFKFKNLSSNIHTIKDYLPTFSEFSQGKVVHMTCVNDILVIQGAIKHDSVRNF